MSIQRFPTGLSFPQAKKDAKQLSKKTGVALSEAQDQIAHQHGRGTWAEVTRQVNTHQSSLPLFQELRSNKPNYKRKATMVVGPDSEKRTAIIFALIESYLKRKNPVMLVARKFDVDAVYPGADKDKVGRITQLQDRYPKLFKLIKTDWSQENSWGKVLNGEELLSGATLFILKPQDILSNTKSEDELFKASKHTVLSLSSQNSLSKTPERVKTIFCDKNVDASVVFLKGSKSPTFTLEWPRDLVESRLKELPDNSSQGDDAALVVSRVQIESHWIRSSRGSMKSSGYVTDAGNDNYVADDPEKAFILNRYREEDLVQGMPTLKISPTLLNSAYLGRPTRINQYQLKIEIPQLNVEMDYKGKFVRPYRNNLYVRVANSLFFQMDIMKWIMMDDEPLEIIYRWSSKTGLDVTQTMKVWLTEPDAPSSDIFPLGETYAIEEDTYAFTDWRMIVQRDEAGLTEQSAIQKAIWNSSRVMGRRFSLESKKSGSVSITEEFDVTRRKDSALTYPFD